MELQIYSIQFIRLKDGLYSPIYKFLNVCLLCLIVDVIGMGRLMDQWKR